VDNPPSIIDAVRRTRQCANRSCPRDVVLFFACTRVFSSAQQGHRGLVIEGSMGLKRPPALDRTDVRILVVLQTDGRSTVQKLAEQVGLSPRACLERLRRLEGAGVILGYQAVVAVEKLSKPVTVIAEIVLEKHGQHAKFEQRLTAIEEVVECWEVSGTFDYIARFTCADLAQYGALTAALVDDQSLGVARIVSHICLRPLRRFAGYPESLLARSVT